MSFRRFFSFLWSHILAPEVLLKGIYVFVIFVRGEAVAWNTKFLKFLHTGEGIFELVPLFVLQEIPN